MNFNYKNTIFVRKLCHAMSKSSTVPLFSAAAVNHGIDLQAAVQRVIASQWFILGAEVKAFEKEFAEYVGAADCVSLANGTDALTLALRAVGVQAGGGVVLVANAGFYGSTAVHAIGASPIYVDVDHDSQTMAAAALEVALVEHKPKAVIVTHLYGQMADLDAIGALCKAHGVALIEDCAQAHGAMRNGARVGSIGDIAAFSFYPTKNLGALGDGGAVTTSNIALADAVRVLRQYGWSHKYEVTTPFGCNSRLDEMQAAILREKLPHLDRQNALRRQIAERYNAAFAGLPLKLPMSIADDYVAHLYVVRTDQRASLASYLKERGVSSDIHYPIADHLQRAYPAAVVTGLTVTLESCGTVLSLPCFPGLTATDIDWVISCVQGFFAEAQA